MEQTRQQLHKVVHMGEDACRKNYFTQIGIASSCMHAIAFGTYWAVNKYAPSRTVLVNQKFEFIHKWGLGYVYGAWYTAYIAKTYLLVNANGARADTGIDRPDQQAYAIHGEEGKANEVRMVNTGAHGRFNRAQRASFRMDEGAALSVTSSLLTAAVFGPVAMVSSLVSLFGWYTYGNDYKDAALNRVGGMIFWSLADMANASLMFLCFVKGVAGLALKN